MKRKPFYYLYKGDEVVDSGTAEELACRRHVKIATIQFYSSTANKKRKKGNGLIAEKVI